MTLPAITTPAGTPKFLASGHNVTEDSVYAQVRPATGHSRARRVWTVTERVADVEWLLSESWMPPAVEAWFEDTLQAGTRTFSARLRNEGSTPDMLWWEMRWVSFQLHMMPLGRARVVGQVMLFGQGSETPPEFGRLAMEIALPLDDVPGPVFIPVAYGMEIFLPLIAGEVAFGVEYELPLEGVDPGGSGGPPSTWNAADKDSDITLSSGDTVASITGAFGAVRGTKGWSTGKHQFEITIGGSIYALPGVGEASASLATYPGADAHSWGYFDFDGHRYFNAADAAYGATFTAGDVIGVVWDATAGEITFYKNGTSQGVAYSSVSGTLYPMWGPGSDSGGPRTATLTTVGLAHPVSGVSEWG